MKERKNMKKYGIIYLLLALIVVFPLIGCNKTTTTTTTTTKTTSSTSTTTTTPVDQPVTGGTLRWIIDQAPTGSLGTPEKMGGSQLYMAAVTEALVKVDAQGTPTGLLAEKWSWSDDYSTVTMNLRQGVKFHDGSDFNADVAVWNLQQRISSSGLGTSNIASVSKVDNYTIKIVTKGFDNTWFSNLRGTLGMMISKKQYDENGADYADTHPCGAGPFIFKEYVENDHLTFIRNDNYWGKKPYLDGVTFMVIVDGTTAQLSFEKGEADILGNVAGGGKTANILKDKGYTVRANPGGLSISLVPSVRDPSSPLASLKVRQAIEYALDKVAIAKNVGQGYYNAWYQLAGPVQKEFDPNFKGRVYDLNKAKQLLKEAGFEQGFATKLICGINLAGDELAIIQSQLAQVNITVTIETCSINQWIDYETNGWDGLIESPMAFMELYGIDVNRYFLTPTQPNWANGIYWNSLYRTPELEKLCQEYFKLPLGDQEVAKGKEIVKWLFDNCSFIPLWDQMGIAIRQTYVKGIDLPLSAGPIGWDYTGTWLAKH
jgi:peptide/nickel transport system substrate-binding protein